MQETNQFPKVNGKLVPFSISKTSIATGLAQSSNTDQITLPKGYEEFSGMFSEEAACHTILTLQPSDQPQ